MQLFAFAALAGIAVGYALGGRLRALAELHLRAPALVWLALGLQLALYAPGARALPDAARTGVIVLSVAVVGVWLLVNTRAATGGLRLAFAVVAAGWLLNVAAIVPNGSMPVSTVALRRAGAPPTLMVDEGHLWKHVAADRATVLPWLGDVLPVRAAGAVVSVGDVVLAVGIGSLVAGAMRRPPARRRRVSDEADGGEGCRTSAVATS